MGAELTTRRLLAMIIVAGFILIGFLGMWWPVYLSEFDQYGIQIDCGSGFVIDLAQAQRADDSGGLAEQCDAAVVVRRAWSIPLMVAGTAVLTTSLVTPGASCLQ